MSMIWEGKCWKKNQQLGSKAFPNINNYEPSCIYIRAEWFKIGSDRFVSFRRSDETSWNSMISPMALCSSNNCDTPGNQPQDKLGLATRHESTHIRSCLPGKAIVVHSRHSWKSKKIEYWYKYRRLEYHIRVRSKFIILIKITLLAKWLKI